MPTILARLVGGSALHYPGAVNVSRLRNRMPLVAFILLALVCLGLFGFACASLEDQPGVPSERALQAPAIPALVEPLSILWFAGLALTVVLAAVPARDRASPALLQRFLF